VVVVSLVALGLVWRLQKPLVAPVAHEVPTAR